MSDETYQAEGSRTSASRGAPRPTRTIPAGSAGAISRVRCFAAATGRLLFKPDGPGRGIARMFPTDEHMNMGGSIHGGAIMSFIDMSMFAGGLCAGMERGHYVTLDLTTHFLARGQAGQRRSTPCRAGPADPRPRLPAGRGQAGRRALLQLQRHPEARPRAQRTIGAMTGPVGPPTTN